jgi:hypothetical protein
MSRHLDEEFDNGKEELFHRLNCQFISRTERLYWGVATIQEKNGPSGELMSSGPSLVLPDATFRSLQSQRHSSEIQRKSVSLPEQIHTEVA